MRFGEVELESGLRLGWEVEFEKGGSDRMGEVGGDGFLEEQGEPENRKDDQVKERKREIRAKERRTKDQ